jgi:hypothetical protein
MNDVTHEDYVASVRSRIATVATQMIDGSIPFLEGARLVNSLLADAEVDDGDPDRVIFRGVESETDSLPIGAVRDLWSEDALARLEPEILAATEWAKEVARDSCASLARRFASYQAAAG